MIQELVTVPLEREGVGAKALNLDGLKDRLGWD